MFFRNIWSQKKILDTVEKHCPKELLRVLLGYRGPGGKVILSEEVRNILNKLFGHTVVYDAIRAAENLELRILIHGRIGLPRNDRWLNVFFDGADVRRTHFSPVSYGGKMGL